MTKGFDKNTDEDQFWNLLKRHEEAYIEGNSLKVGVVGSRDWEYPQKVVEVVDTLRRKPMDICIVSGGCPAGADLYAKEMALSLEIPYKEFTPQFRERTEYTAQPDYMEFDKTYEAYYYFKRNKELAKYCDLVVAFIPEDYIDNPEKATGTKHTLQKARENGTKTMILK